MALMVCLGGGPAVAAPVIPSGGALAFAIVRKGEVIGHYRSDFSSGPDGALQVRTHIKVDFDVGPIRLYAFDHTATEVWRAGRLVQLVADTDDDGARHHLELRQDQAGLVRTIDGKTDQVSADTVPSTLWNEAMIATNRPIVDVVDGRLLKTNAKCRAGSGANGARAATCDVEGDMVRQLHYDGQGLLDRVELTADDGSQVFYQRQ